MIIAVPDTNELVSAACIPKSLPAHLLRFWFAHSYEVALSHHILHEFNDVMRRPKILNRYSITDEAIDSFRHSFVKSALVLTSTEICGAVPAEPADNHVIGCAVECHAGYVVTGDRHFLELGRHGEIQIVTPAEFLADLNAAGIA